MSDEYYTGSVNEKHLLDLLAKHPDTQNYTKNIIDTLRGLSIGEDKITSAILAGFNEKINNLAQQALKESGDKKPYLDIIKQCKDKQDLLKKQGLRAYENSFIE